MSGQGSGSPEGGHAPHCAGKLGGGIPGAVSHPPRTLAGDKGAPLPSCWVSTSPSAGLAKIGRRRLGGWVGKLLNPP